MCVTLKAMSRKKGNGKRKKERSEERKKKQRKRERERDRGSGSERQERKQKRKKLEISWLALARRPQTGPRASADQKKHAQSEAIRADADRKKCKAWQQRKPRRQAKAKAKKHGAESAETPATPAAPLSSLSLKKRSHCLAFGSLKKKASQSAYCQIPRLTARHSATLHSATMSSLVKRIGIFMYKLERRQPHSIEFTAEDFGATDD